MNRANLDVFRARFFPLKRARTSWYRYEALVGIGGTEGEVMGRFVKLMRHWMTSRQLRVIQTSLIVKNPPFGYAHQPDFYNAVARIQTSLSATDFLKVLLQTEKYFRRVRTRYHGPRTLDLDLIFFGNQAFKTSRLTLPHPYWHERTSVLVPLGMMHQRKPR
jgi:2-amino-4-hydroxy-6-hydroxymethyldihydropteridine diphosphokinase